MSSPSLHKDQSRTYCTMDALHSPLAVRLDAVRDYGHISSAQILPTWHADASFLLFTKL